MKLFFVYLVCFLVVGISNAYSKEYIVRPPKNSNFAKFINESGFTH
jgi:hypothetical protein